MVYLSILQEQFPQRTPDFSQKLGEFWFGFIQFTGAEGMEII